MSSGSVLEVDPNLCAKASLIAVREDPKLKPYTVFIIPYSFDRNNTFVSLGGIP